jgi:hypothetical protein
MRSNDPKHASSMISSHSDCFRAVNAPISKFENQKSAAFCFKNDNFELLTAPKGKKRRV